MSRKASNSASIGSPKKRCRRGEKEAACPLQYRVAVMGAAGVGKSDIISQFLYQRRDSLQCQSLQARNKAEYRVRSGRLTLDIVDTFCPDSFPVLRQLFIAASDAFVLVYSVEDEASFQTVCRLKDEIQETKGTDDVPILVVANKMDKCDLTVPDQHLQHVINQMVVMVDWGLGFVETSLDQNGLSGCLVFNELLKRVPDSPRQVTEVCETLERKMSGEGLTGDRSDSALRRLARRVRKSIRRQ